MSCISCGSSNKKYIKFQRMDSLNFKLEDPKYLRYRSIKDKKYILVDRRTFSLGHYFLKNDVALTSLREKNYLNSKGFFKLNLSKIPKSKLESRNMAIMKFKRTASNKVFVRCLVDFEPPVEYRWAFWYVLGTSDQVLTEDDYQRLVRSYKKDVDSIVRKDVPRTFSSNKFFSEKIEEIEVGRELLYKVCKAVGTYFTDVGYCQGLNFLAAFLLQISGGNQMETVNVLVSLMTNSKFLLLGLYDSSFPLVSFLKFLFHWKLKKVNMRIEKALKDSMLPDDVWLTKWFISLMTGYLPKYHAARVLDFVLAYDIFALVSFIISLVESLKGYIVGKTMDVINDVINNNLGRMRKGSSQYWYLKEPSYLLKRAKRYLFSSEEVIKAMEEFREDQYSYGKEEFRRYEPHFRDYLIGKKGRQVEFKVFDFAAESVVAPVSARSTRKIGSGPSLPPIKQRSINGDEITPVYFNPSDIKFEKNQDKDTFTKDRASKRKKDGRRGSSFFQKNDRFGQVNAPFNKKPNAIVVKGRD